MVSPRNEIGLYHMSLRLRLLKSPSGTRLDSSEYVFSPAGGTLGRAESNTWVLPDPDKFLSSCHCEIVFIDNDFHAIDRSTNGTFLNGAIEPIGRGNRTLINDGDVIELGDYRFSVHVSNVTHDDNAQNPFLGFSSSSSNIDSSSLQELDPFSSDYLATEAPVFEEKKDPLDYWGEPSSLRNSPQDFSQKNNDVFSLKDADPFGGDQHNNDKLLDDFLGINSAATNDYSDFGHIDQSPSLDQALSFPSVSRQNVIPDDWDLDFSSTNNATNANQSASQLGNAFEQSDAVAIAPSPPKQVQERPAPDVTPSAPRLTLAERLAALEAAENAERAAPITPKVEPQIKRPSRQPSRPADKESRLIDALGLDKSRVTAEDIAEIETLSGLLLREIIEGMLCVLRSRASIKSEFRMNVTTIQPIENNPLKFSVNADDALENIFLKKSKAYKPPVDAFKEGFQEIAEHQLAMIAGIRAGFDSMMESFNPATLETIFSKQAKSSLLPSISKAKYWASFLEYSKNLNDNLDISFQQLFGSEFVNAYEDQLRRLAIARKQESHYE